MRYAPAALGRLHHCLLPRSTGLLAEVATSSSTRQRKEALSASSRDHEAVTGAWWRGDGMWWQVPPLLRGRPEEIAEPPGRGSRERGAEGCRGVIPSLSVFWPAGGG